MKAHALLSLASQFAKGACDSELALAGNAWKSSEAKREGGRTGLKAQVAFHVEKAGIRIDTVPVEPSALPRIPVPEGCQRIAAGPIFEIYTIAKMHVFVHHIERVVGFCALTP